jgi:hypothetical protein
MDGVVRTFRALGVLFLVCTSIHAQGRIRRHVLVQERELYAASADGFATGTGSLVEVRGGPPWRVADIGASEGGRFLRRFGKLLFVVNTEGGSITQLTDPRTRRSTESATGLSTTVHWCSEATSPCGSRQTRSTRGSQRRPEDEVGR